MNSINHPLCFIILFSFWSRFSIPSSFLEPFIINPLHFPLLILHPTSLLKASSIYSSIADSFCLLLSAPSFLFHHRLIERFHFEYFGHCHSARFNFRLMHFLSYFSWSVPSRYCQVSRGNFWRNCFEFPMFFQLGIILL